MFTDFWNNYLAALTGNLFVLLLAVVISMDMIFGSLRAIKEKKINSSIGIDGGVRKVGMVVSALVLTLFDMILLLNLIGWVPEGVRKVLTSIGIVKIGTTELFCLLFVLYEVTSVLKNMCLCGLPIPKFIRAAVEKWLTEMTEETGAFNKTGTEHDEKSNEHCVLDDDPANFAEFL